MNDRLCGYDPNELEYYEDLAVNECQRWLEIVSREMFIDRDDILYSLRYGSHLRRVINTVLPDCFDLSPNRFENPTRSTRTVLQNAGLNEDIIEKYIEDEDWISQFLLICWKRLLIPPERLFHANDLIGNDDLSQPYKSFITKCASTSTWKLEFDQNERIRRVCTTIAALSEQCRQSNPSQSQLDRSSLEPLLEYREVFLRSPISRSTRLVHPLDKPLFDIVKIVSDLVDSVSCEEETKRLSNTSLSTDEGLGTMADCTSSTSKCLVDIGSEYSTEDLSSFSSGTKSSRSSSPYTGERCFSNGDSHIPTRPNVRLASQVAHNPLQFISATTAATALCEKAKQQIIVSEEQKKLRAEALQKISQRDKEDAELQASLASWKAKRRSALLNRHKHLENNVEPRFSSNGILATSSGERNHSSKNNEEILTVVSPPHSEEQTDSGIENSRNFSNPQSPTSSLDLSPRSDSKFSSESSSDQVSPKRFIRTASPLVPPDDLPPSPPPSVPVIRSFYQRNQNADQTASGLKSGILSVQPKEKRRTSHVVWQGQLQSNIDDSNNSYSDRSPPPPPTNNVLKTVSAYERAINEQRHQRFDRDHGTTSPSSISRRQTPSKHGSDVNTEMLHNDMAIPRKFEELFDETSVTIELRRQQTANVTGGDFPCRQQAQVLFNCEAPMQSHSNAHKMYHTTQFDTESPDSMSCMATTTLRFTEGSRSYAPLESSHTESNIYSSEPHRTTAIEKQNRGGALVNESTFVPKVCPVRRPRSIDRQRECKPDSNGYFTINIELGHHSKIPERGFGFMLTGGKDKHAPVTVDAVIVGTPADRCGLQIGDEVLSINGESVEDRYHLSVNRMLLEAVRLGEIEMRMRRKSAKKPNHGPSPPRESDIRSSSASFDEKRSVFDHLEKRDPYYEFREQKRQKNPPSKYFRQQPLNAPCKSTEQIDRNNFGAKMPSTTSEYNRYRRSSFAGDNQMASSTSINSVASTVSPPPHTSPIQTLRSDSPKIRTFSPSYRQTDCDYKVTSFHEKPDPGKLTDFIPEVERAALMNESSSNNADFTRKGYIDEYPSSVGRSSNASPILVRNYEITPTGTGLSCSFPRKKQDKSKVVDSCIAARSSDHHEWLRTTAQHNRQPYSADTSLGANSIHDGVSAFKKYDEKSAPMFPASRRNFDTPSAGQHRGVDHRTRNLEELSLEERHGRVEADSPITDIKPHERSRQHDFSGSSEEKSRDPSKGRKTTMDGVVAVSGKHRCAHCKTELGRGAAMIIESLNLYYHLSCFRCFICNVVLGNGSQGIDVRVRNGKLHCQNCYEVEDDTMNFTKV